MLFDQSELGHSVRTGCTSRGVGTMFDQSEHGYSVRHRVYVRFSTNQSTAIAYVTGCTYAFRPISARRSRILISVAPCGGLRNLAQPQKSGSKTSYYTTDVSLERHLEKKKSVVRIQNKDDLCMARALVVAKAKVDEGPQYKYVANHRKSIQTRLVQELHTNTNVPLGPCGIEEAKLFQTYLAEYQINIVSKEYNNKIIYSGPEKDKIYLYMHNNHYNVITKMPGFFARAYYCHECMKAYNYWETHLCLNTCKCCGSHPISSKVTTVSFNPKPRKERESDL